MHHTLSDKSTPIVGYIQLVIVDIILNPSRKTRRQNNVVDVKEGSGLLARYFYL